MMTINDYLKAYRKAARKAYELRDLSDREVWASAELDLIEHRQNLFELIMQLDNVDEAEALVLYYLNGASIESICREMLTFGEPSSIRKIWKLLRNGKDHLDELLRTTTGAHEEYVLPPEASD